MTNAIETDLGPLNWVKGEIDAALARAREALEQAGSAGDPAVRVQFAQTHLNQVRGALSIVGLDGLTQFAEAAGLLLGDMARGVVQPDGHNLGVGLRALAALGNYLEELVQGVPDQPLRLAPLHDAIAAARGQPSGGALDLFHPDLSLRPPRREESLTTPDEAQAMLRGARARFERGLLEWLRKGAAGNGAAQMREAIVAVEALQPTGAARALWWASLGFFDALIAGTVAADAGVKKLCAQIDAQFRRLMSGNNATPERLLREILYHVATAPATTEQQRAIRACWRLDALLPAPGASVSEVPLAPLLQALRNRLGAMRMQWDAFCAGTAIALAHFEDELGEFARTATSLARPGVERLVGGLVDFTRWLRHDPLKFSDSIAFEVAGVLLQIEGAIAPGTTDTSLAAETDATLARLAALRRGETLAPQPISAGDSGARAHEREALAQLAKEMLSSLAQIEQTLDDFFRNPQKRAALGELNRPMQQILGALSLLGETEAIELMRAASVHVAHFAAPDAAPDQAAFEELAHKLSALGFFIESLPHKRADLHALLEPGAATPSAEAPTPEARAEAGATLTSEDSATPHPAAAAAARAALDQHTEHAAPATSAPVPAPLEGAEALATVGEEHAPDPMPSPVPANEPALAAPTSGPAEVTAAQPEMPAGGTPEWPAPAAPAEALAVAAPPSAAAAVEPAPNDAAIDAELLGIFIEEAYDVLSSIGEHLELSRSEPQDPAHLTVIRRGFHTLKGSGRMVGLGEIGEAAWAVEQTLNRWLQLEWLPTPALHHLIDAARQLFTAWVAQLEAGGPQGRDAGVVVAEAERLRNAETPPVEPGTFGEPFPGTFGEPTLAAFGELTPAALDTPEPVTTLQGDEGTPGTTAAAPELSFPSLDLAATGEILPLPAGDDSAALAPLEPLEEFELEPAALGFADEPSVATVEAGAPEAGAPEAAATSSAPDSVRIGDADMSPALYDLYRTEAAAHLATLHEEFARLAANRALLPPDNALRAVHTLAGISGTARLTPLHTLGRALEHAIERVRHVGRPPLDDELALLSASAATLQAMLGEVLALRMPASDPTLEQALDTCGRAPAPEMRTSRAPAAPDEGAAIAAEESVMQPQAAAEPVAHTPAMPVAATAEAAPQDDIDTQLLPLFLEEAADLLGELHATLRAWDASPDDGSQRLSVARLLHSLKGSARMAGAMALGEHLHQLESRLEGDRAGQPLIEELAAGIDAAELMIDALAAGEPMPAQAAPAMPEAVPDVMLTAAPAAAEAEAGPAATLRVRADLIDRFVNQAGEIGIARTRIEGELRTLRGGLLELTDNVIRLRNQLREVELQADMQMQSRIARSDAHHGEFDPLEMDRYTRLQELTRMLAESVNDVTTVQQALLHNLDGADLALNSQARQSRELQQALMRVRMLPFDSLADRLYRVVRQSARELGKRAHLDLRGGRIEVDRSVLEQMAAPLEHLLRNAVAHGIETPERRRAAGKPEIGQLSLSVRQEGNEIAIELTDDGTGLDFARIEARARASGLIEAHEQVDLRRLTNLIFLPGFSTAHAVSAVSGRGVGMDVVKAQTAAVGGRIDVRSRQGEGTTFLIHLPLTLAVTQALLVRAAGRTYAIPSSMVAQVMELKSDALRRVQAEHGTEWLGEHYAYRYLPRLLGDNQTQPEEQRYNWLLLLRAGAQTLALHVDALRGNQEIVVKNAGPQLTRIVGMSGATVLGDGEIVLILNPVALASRGLGQDAGIEAVPGSGGHPAHVPTVLVVDDSLTVRKVTGRLLEREGYRVITAKDGVDALEKLVETLPDVVLSDIEMPRMDGFDLVRNIRSDARTRDLPVIMITSRLAEKHRSYAAEVGANHYLGKPYQEEELLTLLAGYTGREYRPESAPA
ncbi:Hpt domain-containing protein [Thauera sp. 2A1]|uniref:hybrid sensor histidine kinase/response regulator n=1 Tax=Thauera sp. 2A1 TaxID=2570191 RepID=UPI001290A2D4|nr:Hpt domain-containing protein [Thauera sp. 2A1]KAI5914742.1 Hpt domain-containing protein [Thauera sp. 2A1]